MWIRKDWFVTGRHRVSQRHPVSGATHGTTESRGLVGFVSAQPSKRCFKAFYRFVRLQFCPSTRALVVLSSAALCSPDPFLEEIKSPVHNGYTKAGSIVRRTLRSWGSITSHPSICSSCSTVLPTSSWCIVVRISAKSW